MIEPAITPLPEPGHTGYDVLGPAGRVVIDPPLTVDIDPTGIIAIVETSISVDRFSGARLLAERTGLPILGPVATPALRPVDPGSTIGNLVMVRSVLDEQDHLVLTTVNEATVLIGSLDRVPHAEPARSALAQAYPAATFLGAAGSHTAAELASLTPPRQSPLNRHAVTLTNRGEADLYWADPRFPDPASSIPRDQLEARLAGPWPPTIVCLDSTAGGPHLDGARHVPPESLASSVSALAGEREIVVHAAEPDLAQAAAGFLVRLGLNAAWLSD